MTFGLSYCITEFVQLIWGRAPVDYRVPALLDGPLFTIYTTTFPAYRGFMMLVAVLMLVAVYLLFTKTRIGLVIQGALSHPRHGRGARAQRAARVHDGVRRRLRASPGSPASSAATRS